MIMKIRVFGIILSSVVSLALLSGCKEELKLSDYVSENRTGYYLTSSEPDGISLKAFYTLREYPYAADGVARETSGVFEVKIKSETYFKSVEVSFSLGGEECGGAASYDGAEKVYEYSVSALSEPEDSISFTVTADGGTYSLSAENKNSGYLSGGEILSAVKAEKSEYIDSLIANDKFNGEIYLRFIFDEKGYYYVGLISKERGTLSLLVDASTGKIIAERES